MTTSAVNNGTPQGGAAPAAPTPPANTPAPATPPVAPPEGGAPPQPGTNTPPAPAAAAPAAPAAPKPDAFAGSDWPPSAKDRVKRQSGKIRDLTETIAQKNEYIKQLEERAKALSMPQRENFPDDAAFFQAVSDFNAEKTGLATERHRTQGEIKSVEGQIASTGRDAQTAKVDVARERFSDWDTVLQASQLQPGQHLTYALHMASNGPEIAYMLNKLPREEFYRLNSMIWTDALQAFSDIERRFTATQQPATPPGPSVPPTPPIAPVGGGSLPTGSKYKEWEAQRNQKAGLF